MYEDGYSISAIARTTGFVRKTVKRYLDPDVSVVHASYGTTRKAL
ncbi:helix-turn-helix domain-containing protein [Anaeromonas gelatinilytica]